MGHIFGVVRLDGNISVMATRFTGGAWISLGYGSGGNWNIQTIVDLNNRSDTHNPNYSPSTFSRAIYSCFQMLDIQIFYSKKEILDKIAFKHKPNDLTLSTQTFKGITSSVWLYRFQSLMWMEIESGVGGQLLQKQLQYLNFNPMLFLTNLMAIDVDGPRGLLKSNIKPDDQGRPNTWLVGVTWSPLKSDQGTHIICASAANQFRKLSDTRCINVIAWDIDPCDSSPCQHESTCKRVGYTSDFICTCVPEYTGKLRETDINECASFPCQHGGACLDLINIYYCHCPSGFNDFNCETNIDDCISNPCQHNGTCIDLVDGCKCQCTDHSKGGNCETSKCNCQNWKKGDKCETRIDHCSSSPCLHNGVCMNGLDSYTCQCDDLWHGDRCEFKEVNRTKVCTDLEYTECSCHISKLSPSKRKSYTLTSGFTGPLTGLLLTVIYYIGWTLCNKTDHMKKVEPTQNIISVIDLESTNQVAKVQRRRQIKL
ncbi:NOTCH1 [Mytilus coruscus]|uniref:NOTCH1 n=1 Tax=Mytilus coruscus TaxID=42192 RepID=A0A6J8DBS8_MYTCO|nr:NOTCH1 [Mytilus coruscus]